MSLLGGYPADVEDGGPREQLRQRLELCVEDVELFTLLAADMLEKRAKDQTLSRLLLFSGLENAKTLSNRFFRTYIADYYDVLAGSIKERIISRRLQGRWIRCLRRVAFWAWSSITRGCRNCSAENVIKSLTSNT